MCSVAHPNAALVAELPCVANVSLGQLIAEVGPLLERCDNPEQVDAMRGLSRDASVGQDRTIGFRYAANKPAQVAITGFADNFRHAWSASDFAAEDRYQQARARGASHPTPRVQSSMAAGPWPSGRAGTPAPLNPSRHRGEQLARR